MNLKYVVAVAAILTMAGCGPSSPMLLDGSSQQCPAAPPTESTCTTIGTRCVYSSASCSSFVYACQVDDGGTQAHWIPALCD